jgi:Tfp pilus assembly protein PilN
MKLHLNLATAPQPNNRPFMAGAVVTGAIGLIAFAILSHAAYASWRNTRDLRAQVARLDAAIQADQQRQQSLEAYFRSPGAQRILTRAAFLNSLIDQRSFPWTKVFTDLEKTLPPGVRVISISPALTNGRAEVTLKVGALTDQSKIQFLQAVEKSSVFSGMVVKDEQRSNQQSTVQDPIVLNLTVWYATT